MKYEVPCKMLQKLPESILSNQELMSKHYRVKQDDYYFNRHPEVFTYILHLCRTGELHLPNNVCGTVIKSELEYWGVNELKIEMCCWTRYKSDLDTKSTLKQFDHTMSRMRGGQSKYTDQKSRWQRFRFRIWELLDNPASSVFAMIYAVLSIFMVLLATTIFCVETLPYFRVNMTTKHYAEYYGVPIKDLAEDWGILNEYPDYFGDASSYDEESSGANPSDLSTHPSPPIPNNRVKRSFKLADENLVVFPMHQRGTSQKINNNDDVEIVENVLSNYKEDFIDGSKDERVNRIKRAEPTTSKTPPNTSKKQPKFKRKDDEIWAPNPTIEIIDYVCMGFFTLELIIRFLFSPSKKDFIKDTLNIVDFASILPFYILLIVDNVYDEQKYVVNAVDAIYVLKVLRVFRIFRLVRHNKGLRVLLYTFKHSWKEIILLLIFMLIGMIIFASLIYYFDRKSGVFTSIPYAFWWAVVTMTTVGYGDAVPKTNVGYLVGSLCAVSGVMVIAFTVPSIVNNFLLFYNHVQYEKSVHNVDNITVANPKCVKVQSINNSSFLGRKNASVEPNDLNTSNKITHNTTF